MTLKQQFEELEKEIVLMVNMNTAIGDDETVYDSKDENHTQASKVWHLFQKLKMKVIEL